MKNMMVVAMFSSVLAGCAGLQPPIGASEAAVLASLGQPTGRYAADGDTLLEYSQGPMGQTTYMARLDHNGRLTSFEQVLSSEQFARVVPRRDSKQTILTRYGQPNQVVHYASVHCLRQNQAVARGSGRAI